MSSSYMDIYQLLIENLQAIPGIPSVQWENWHYEPEDNELYFETHLEPNQTDYPTIGVHAPRYESGVFLINVVGIRYQGYGDCYTWADTLINNFTRGEVLTNSAINLALRISKSTIRPGFYNDSGRYVVPVMVHYFTYDFN